jgi:catalase
VLWDEAVKISGADSDMTTKDLWQSIDAGDFPEWQLGLQIFTEEQAEGFDFDVLDPTKLVPEELVPVEIVGRMVLDRNPDNFFAETEQVAFCPSHVVPGIGFSNDPLLQGRLFSYLDTQLSRLGGPNFHELPINRPRCPFANDQRDGISRHQVNKGRVAYDPSSLQGDKPLESHRLGYETFPEPVSGDKLRERAESFADHYTQARLFWVSQTQPEQDHIVAAFAFELGMVDTPEVRARMIGNLIHVDQDLAARVAAAVGMDLPPATEAARPAGKVTPSDALSILKNQEPRLPGKKVGVLVTDGLDTAALEALRQAVEAEGAKVALVAPRRGGVKAKDGAAVAADHALAGGPSVLFDAVAILGDEAAVEALTRNANALDFVRDAYAHLKVIGFDAAGRRLLTSAGVPCEGEGFVDLQDSQAAGFVEAFRALRIWKRAPAVMAQV